MEVHGGGSNPHATATDRLRERMQNRSNGMPSFQVRQSSVNADASSWKDRIEARQREAEEQQVAEMEHKRNMEERSSRRNDAMRRVMDRQQDRQRESAELET